MIAVNILCICEWNIQSIKACSYFFIALQNETAPKTLQANLMQK